MYAFWPTGLNVNLLQGYFHNTETLVLHNQENDFQLSFDKYALDSKHKGACCYGNSCGISLDLNQ